MQMYTMGSSRLDVIKHESYLLLLELHDNFIIDIFYYRKGSVHML